MTILIIEDDQSVLSLVERLLRAKGHTILVAHDPHDASVVLARHGTPPDMLLTDIILGPVLHKPFGADELYRIIDER